MNNKSLQVFFWWLLSAVCLVSVSSVSGEDIEIFADEIPPAEPNILMVLDHSGSMNLGISGGTGSRLDSLRVAFNSIMSDADFANVKVGLMGFSNGRSAPFPHGVSFPVSNIDDESTPIMLSNLIPYTSTSTSAVGYFTLADDNLPDAVAGESVREFLPRILSSWNAWGNTPLVDAYFEAALYFRGDKPKWGLATPEQNHAAHPSTYKGSSEGTITQVLTGSTAVCDAPDCGINCLGITEQAICNTGETSCGLGTNCATTPEIWTAECSLGNEADCLASNPGYTSCAVSGTSSCSTSCISGVYHPETGICIPDALGSFTIKTHAANMCLEVNGTTLTQEVCSGSTEQVFYSTEARPGYVKIHASNNNCIDVFEGSTADMAEIIAYSCGSGTSGNQVFSLSGGNIIADHSGKCLNVPQYSELAGETLVQYTCEGRTNQVFSMSNEATSCAVNDMLLCQYPQEVTRCDHQKYRCDETRDEVSLDSFDIVYDSPITGECQNNAIILLSDGDPYVPDRTQYAQTMVDVKALTESTSDCAGTTDGRCGAELASYMASVDQSDEVEGDNFINTYTIGFDVRNGSAAETFLKGVANAGGGNYFPASDAAGLAAVFKSIVSDVSKTARSYAAPTYTVDQNSLLSHSRDVYIPLFENGAAPRWSGNLKKFKLNASGQIIDKAGDPAVSAEGVLDPEAVDYWTATATTATAGTKPNPVTSGGVANRLDPANRNLLTDNGSSLVTLDSTSVSKLAITGDATAASALSDQEYQAMLSFIRGYNSDGTSRNHIGDILHNKPMVVSYGDKDVIFFATNEGFVHAINAEDVDTTGGGTELFAYMPKDLLSNIPGQYRNDPLTGSIKRIYGVDGEITVWINDKNKNGQFDAGASGDAAESVYLFFGLRRGGNAYYALDVTNPASPSLAWSISNRNIGFERMGQTWSKPVISKLRYKASGVVKDEEVLIFGGGYDAAVYDEEDTTARLTGAAKGNGIYIVNAKSGTLIKSFVGGDMTHSIPGNIRVMDMDRNGSIDRMYFGDLGGNVWRADLNVDDVDDDVSLNDVIKDARVYRLATLGGTGEPRKFFYEPDVSLFKHNGKLTTVVSIGSGYRSHPKNTNIQDRLYVLHDENAVNVPKTVPQAIVEGELSSASGLAGKDFLLTHKGWYLDLSLSIGEKSLSTPLIFMNKIMFTTFGLTTNPVSAGGANSCTTKTNNLSRAYVLDLMTASATVDLDGDGVIGNSDISTIVGVGDIPDSPKLVFNSPSNCGKKGCDQFVDVRIGKLQTPIISRNTVGGNVNLGDFLPKVFWLDSNQ